MNLVKAIGEIIDVREELKELAREIEWKSKKLDRSIDSVMEFLKHHGLVETRRMGSSKEPSQDGT
jgi:hypothetical protein